MIILYIYIWFIFSSQNMGIIERIHKTPDDIKTYISMYVPYNYCANCYKMYQSFEYKYCCRNCNYIHLYNDIKNKIVFFFYYLCTSFFFIYFMLCIISVYLLVMFLIVKVTYDYIFIPTNKVCDMI